MGTRGRRQLATLAVALLLLFAGCNAFTESITPTAAPTPTETPTATPSPTPSPAPTATPSPTPSPTPTEAPSDDTSSSEITEGDWQQLLDSHKETITNADSWRGGIVVRFGGDKSALRDNEVNVTIAGAVRDDEKRRFTRFGPTRIEKYTAESEAPIYERTNQSGTISYSTTEEPFDFRPFEEPFDAATLASFEFTDEGTVQTQQGERLKLSVSDPAQVGPEARSDLDGDITDVRLQVLIDTDRDVVTRMEYVVELERAEGTVVLRYEFALLDINNAVVDEPEWLDEAREQTDG